MGRGGGSVAECSVVLVDMRGRKGVPLLEGVMCKRTDSSYTTGPCFYISIVGVGMLAHRR